jgi:Domain of unknown function (DUF4389)
MPAGAAQPRRRDVRHGCRSAVTPDQHGRHRPPRALAPDNIVAFLGWFYSLVFGRMNQGMRDTSVWLFRFEVQTYAYVFLLTSRYPNLAGAPTV